MHKVWWPMASSQGFRLCSQGFICGTSFSARQLPAIHTVTLSTWMNNDPSQEFSRKTPRTLRPSEYNRHHSAPHLVYFSFLFRLGVANSDLLRCYMSLDPRIPQLVFIVRAWAKAKALTAGRHLTNYALTLMVLYFLQTQKLPVIPSLQQGFESWLKEQSDSCNKESHGYHESLDQELESKMIDNWNCSFFTDAARLSSSNNNKSLSK